MFSAASRTDPCRFNVRAFRLPKFPFENPIGHASHFQKQLPYVLAVGAVPRVEGVNATESIVNAQIWTRDCR